MKLVNYGARPDPKSTTRDDRDPCLASIFHQRDPLDLEPTT